jgi:hypothetical protein
MALGTNRDYKTTDRRVRQKLALYAQILKDLVDLGVSKEQAENQAGEMVLHPVAYHKPLAATAIDDGVPERMFLSMVRYPDLLKAARKAYRAAKAEAENRP